MNESSIISEITVPIIYQNKIILGYIQVNSSSVLSLSALHNYKRLAMIIENKIIEEEDKKNLELFNAACEEASRKYGYAFAAKPVILDNGTISCTTGIIKIAKD